MSATARTRTWPAGFVDLRRHPDGRGRRERWWSAPSRLAGPYSSAPAWNRTSSSPPSTERSHQRSFGGDGASYRSRTGFTRWTVEPRCRSRHEATGVNCRGSPGRRTAIVLPENEWSGRRDSNPLVPAWKAGARPVGRRPQKARVRGGACAMRWVAGHRARAAALAWGVGWESNPRRRIEDPPQRQHCFRLACSFGCQRTQLSRFRGNANAGRARKARRPPRFFRGGLRPYWTCRGLLTVGLAPRWYPSRRRSRRAEALRGLGRRGYHAAASYLANGSTWLVRRTSRLFVLYASARYSSKSF